MFSGLRANSIFYILEKGEFPTLKTGQIISVSNPTPKYQQYSPNQIFGQNVEMVVDIKAKVGDETMDFKQLPSNLSIANFGQSNIVVSESRDAMLSEAEGMMRVSQGVLESMDYHKNMIDACDGILQTLNPQFAKEREQEQKIGTLESKVTGMEDTLQEIKDMIARSLNSSKS